MTTNEGEARPLTAGGPIQSDVSRGGLGAALRADYSNLHISSGRPLASVLNDTDSKASLQSPSHAMCLLKLQEKGTTS